MTLSEHIRARGHENVTAEHASTFEVTSDDFLTPAGDCIVGIEADRTPADFDDAFVAACQESDAVVTVTLAVGDIEERIEGHGHPELTFEGDRSLVCRTSEYVDDRTVAIGMENAAGDLDRELVERLADGAELMVTLSVETESQEI